MKEKVFFHLVPDEDGWPPVSAESVWTSACDEKGHYVMDNIPFFTRDATDGDVIAVEQDDTGILWFKKVIRPSRNSLIRIIFFDQSRIDPIQRELESLGCSFEYMAAFSLLAVSIPAGVDLKQVRKFLDLEERAALIGYEEAILWDQ